MSTTVVEEVLAASRKLLACIDAGNWAEYVKLCDESITCFEPEALGHLVVVCRFTSFTSTCRPAIRRVSRRWPRPRSGC